MNTIFKKLKITNNGYPLPKGTCATVKDGAKLLSFKESMQRNIGFSRSSVKGDLQCSKSKSQLKQPRDTRIQKRLTDQEGNVKSQQHLIISPGLVILV